MLNKNPDRNYIHSWIELKLTELFGVSKSVFTLFMSPKVTYVTGSEGQSCTKACQAANTKCSDSVHGAATYGIDIARDAVKKSGLPLRGNDEFQDNLRVRDRYEVLGDNYKAVPGFFSTEDGKADLNWKNPSHTQTPSTCGASWDHMMRICACDP